MSGTKFYIHGRGMWRELNENEGSVHGWGKVQFVSLDHGRLVAVSRNSVLKGLRALLAGKPTSVVDGPRLSVITPKKKDHYHHDYQNESHHCTCCSCQRSHNYQQFAKDILFNSLLKQSTVSTGIQCGVPASDPVNVIWNSPPKTKVIEIEEPRPPKNKKPNAPRKELIIDEEDVLLLRSFIENDRRNIFNISLIDYDADDNVKRLVFYKINPLVVVEKSSCIAQMVRPLSQCSSVTLDEFISNLGLQSVDKVSKKSKYRMRQRKAHSVKSSDTETDKENVRNNTLRTSMKKSIPEKSGNKNIKYIQTKLLVSNQERKFSGFKNKNQLNIARRTRATLKNKESSDTDEYVFKKTLKSRRDTDRSRNRLMSSESEAQSKKIKHTSLNLNKKDTNAPIATQRNLRNKVSDISSDEDAFKSNTSKALKLERPKQASSIGKSQNKSKDSQNENKQNTSKSNRPALRVYSRKEDLAIVSWLQQGDRASLVKGNCVWKELKPEHYRTTGQHRPWQSLRNRYLRYILPTLGALAVPPALAQTLRAAAARGSLKSRSNSADNSIFKTAPVLSAFARQPKSRTLPTASPPSRTTRNSPSSRTTRSSSSTSSPSRTTRNSPPSRTTRNSHPTSPPSRTTRNSHPTSPPSRTTRNSSRTRSRAPSPVATTSKSAKRESTSSDTQGSEKPPSKRTRRSFANSPTLPTPKTKPRRESLTYSELTRRFASRHKSTPQSGSDSRGEKRRHTDSSDSDDAKTRKVRKQDTSPKKVSKQEISPSLLTRRPPTRSSNRFENKTPERTKTRRLYNPRNI